MLRSDGADQGSTRGRFTTAGAQRGAKKGCDGVDYARRGRLRTSHRRTEEGSRISRAELRRRRPRPSWSALNETRTDHEQTFGHGNGLGLGRAVVELGQHGLFAPRNRKV